MTHFLNGPAAGVSLELERAPVYLRVTRRDSGSSDEWDALDQIGDRAQPEERLYAYHRMGTAGRLHVQRVDSRGRRCGGYYAMAKYSLVDPQPSDHIMRDNARWREWAEAQHAEEQTLEPARSLVDRLASDLAGKKGGAFPSSD